MSARATVDWLWRGLERNLSVVVVLMLWEITTRAGLFNNFLLPPLSKVLVRGWADLLNGELPRQVLATGTYSGGLRARGRDRRRRRRADVDLGDRAADHGAAGLGRLPYS